MLNALNFTNEYTTFTQFQKKKKNIARRALENNYTCMKC